MSPRFLTALETFRHAAQTFNQRDPNLKPLLERAFSDDLDRASDAIRRIERESDPALAALAWGFFWIRQGDFSQARKELTSVDRTGQIRTLWGGVALMMLGELCLEMGETQAGQAFLRRAKLILEPPT